MKWTIVWLGLRCEDHDGFHRGNFILSFFVSCLMSWGAIAVSSAVAAAQSASQYKQEYYQSFKGPPSGLWDFVGPEAQQCVRFETDGLRITLPTGFPKVRGETGVRANIEAAGDFEITMDFEILHEPDPPDAGFGTRLTLVIQLDNLQDTHATLSRMITSKGLTQFTAWASPLKEVGVPPKQRMGHLLTQAGTGRLRLVRTGSDISYLVSEGPDGEFKEVQKVALGSEPVKSIRIVGTTGGDKASLDFRVHDLRVRAESLANVPTAALPKRWLLAGVLIALLLLFSIALGLWLYKRF